MMLIEDEYLRHYYQLHGLRRGNLSSQELQRIATTIELVPPSWHSIIDVGCGDGRVSISLIDQGVEVVGIDWSETSLNKFTGKKIVANIRQPWPFNQAFDGAICAEVLEHLPLTEARKIVKYIISHTREGFIVSVPARENLVTKTISCPACGQSYHLWGHVQSFKTFEEVDHLVGLKSVQRAFVPDMGVRPSVSIDRMKRSLKSYPYEENALCPSCGVRLPAPQRCTFFQVLFLRLIHRVEAYTSYLRPETGWFLCRYNP